MEKSVVLRKVKLLLLAAGLSAAAENAHAGKIFSISCVPNEALEDLPDPLVSRLGTREQRIQRSIREEGASREQAESVADGLARLFYSYSNDAIEADEDIEGVEWGGKCPAGVGTDIKWEPGALKVFVHMCNAVRSYSIDRSDLTYIASVYDGSQKELLADLTLAFGDCVVEEAKSNRF